MTSLEFGQVQVSPGFYLTLLSRQTLFHNARLQNYILYFYVHRKIGSKIYTIRLNYKPCNVVRGTQRPNFSKYLRSALIKWIFLCFRSLFH